MRRSYAWAWAAVFFIALARMTWTFGGRAFWRRYVVGFAGVPEEARGASHFVAVAFPRLSDSGEPFTMLSGDFEQIVRQLSSQGYVSIGLDDVRDFYRNGRPLPPMAILIALDRDDPASIALADRALRRGRMKGVVFVNETSYGNGQVRRHSLTPHALADMVRSGAWDFGWFSDQEMPQPADRPDAPVLDGTKDSAWSRNCQKYPFRFSTSPLGYNGPDEKMCALRIMRARPDRTADDNVRAIDANWPRRRPFFDEFRTGKLGTDWIINYGVVSATRNRLAVIPLPRQTGASVFLNGTEDWTDQVVELEVAKYKSAFWVYARYKEGSHYVRVGAKNGRWKVEEKPAPDQPPRTLASWPIEQLPARLSLTLKNDSAIVHVNGRLAFRHALAVDDRVDSGRLELNVFDVKRWNSIGELTLFRASPLAQQWVVLSKLPEDFGPDMAQQLHDQAVMARGLSPLWFVATREGTLQSAGQQLRFARALSGFNRATLAPMVQLAAGSAWLKDSAARGKLVEDLATAAQATELPGVNLRIPAAERSAAMPFAGELRQRLRASGLKLWVTLDGDEPPQIPWARVCDGVLRPVRWAPPSLEILEIYDMEAASNASHRP